jgi:Ni/Co efflux regulator RcnB
MKKLLAIILLAFTFSLFLAEAHASPAEGRETVKIQKKHRGHHHSGWHRHHSRHTRKSAIRAY